MMGYFASIFANALIQKIQGMNGVNETANNTDVTINVDSKGHLFEGGHSYIFIYIFTWWCPAVASAIIHAGVCLILTQTSGDEGRTINTRRQIRQQRLLDWRRQRRHRHRIDDSIDKYSTAIIELFEYPRHHDTTRYRHSPTARTASRTQQETLTTSARTLLICNQLHRYSSTAPADHHLSALTTSREQRRPLRAIFASRPPW